MAGAGGWRPSGTRLAGEVGGDYSGGRSPPRIAEKGRVRLASDRGRPITDWSEREIRWAAVEGIGERYRRYRLPDAAAEAGMTGSMARYGQLSPLAVCLREETPEVLVGFKRVAAAARALPRVSSLEARLREVDERAGKAMMPALNGTGRGMKGLEEAWIVHSLVREDGFWQVQVGELLERHKSWGCRRLALARSATVSPQAPESKSGRLGNEARSTVQTGLLRNANKQTKTAGH